MLDQRVSSVLTELLLDDFENLLLIKLLRKSLDGSQGLASIAFCVMAS
jgi:hypothetical protein